MSTASAFAETQAVQDGEYPYKDLVQTAQISEEEVALMRELYEWNGPAGGRTGLLTRCPS